jgi:hypothetical protein
VWLRALKTPIFCAKGTAPAERAPAIHATLFIGNDSNPHFVGSADDVASAEVIGASKGSRGHTADYVFDLDDSRRELGASDTQVARSAHLARNPPLSFTNEQIMRTSSPPAPAPTCALVLSSERQMS